MVFLHFSSLKEFTRHYKSHYPYCADLCGEGPFSQVFRGTFKGSVVAVKRLKAPLLSKDKNYFKAEVSFVFIALLLSNLNTITVAILRFMSLFVI